MLLNLARSMPPRAAGLVLYSYLTIFMMFRFLFATVYGWLILSILLYLYFAKYGSFEPLSAEELLLWLAGLREAYKVALISSVVTIVGFFVAFHSATANWRDQFKTQLKAAAAEEIRQFFTVVSSNITTVEIYAEGLVETVNMIQSGEPKQEIEFRVRYELNRREEFLRSREVLYEAAVNVHTLFGKYSYLFSSEPWLVDNGGYLVDQFPDLQGCLGIFIPYIDENEPNFIQTFLNQVNVAECQNLIDTCEKVAPKINSISGAIHGQLVVPIVGFNFNAYRNLRKQKQLMPDFFASLTR